MSVDTNEPQQVVEASAEPTVEDGDVTTGLGHLERMAQLRREATEPVSKYLRKLHSGMGLPSAAVLTPHTSKCGGARGGGEVRETVRVCSVHAPKTAPRAAKTGPSLAQHFNDRVQMDVFCVQLTTRRAAALHRVDTASSFGAARVLKEERGADVVPSTRARLDQALRMTEALQFAEARCFCSREVAVFRTLWC